MIRQGVAVVAAFALAGLLAPFAIDGGIQGEADRAEVDVETFSTTSHPAIGNDPQTADHWTACGGIAGPTDDPAFTRTCSRFTEIHSPNVLLGVDVADGFVGRVRAWVSSSTASVIMTCEYDGQEALPHDTADCDTDSEPGFLAGQTVRLRGRTTIPDDPPGDPTDASYGQWEVVMQNK